MSIVSVKAIILALLLDLIVNVQVAKTAARFLADQGK